MKDESSTRYSAEAIRVRESLQARIAAGPGGNDLTCAAALSLIDKLLAEAVRSERGAWIDASRQKPLQDEGLYVLAWFPGMKRPDVVAARSVQQWATGDDPIPGVLWQPLPPLPDERPDS